MDKRRSSKQEHRKHFSNKKIPSHLNQSSSSHDFQIMHYHQPIGTTEMDQLFSSRDRLIEFSDKIGHIKFSGIRKDVSNHCSKSKFTNGNSLTFENVEKMVKNRIQKMIKNKRIKKNWSQQDVKILIWVVSKYAEFRELIIIQKQLDSQDWRFIASLIPGVQGQHCMFKWLSLKKNNLSENNWSQKQSNLLDKIVKKLGDEDWSIISQQLYYSNNSVNKTYRCPKQCRQHWNCYLNPKLKKGPWSKNQDLLLLNCVKENNGSKKWAQMIGLFNGRTENALKNRFTLIMQKQLKVSEIPQQASQLDLINQYLQRTFVEQFVCKNEEKKKQKIEQMQKQKEEEQKKQVRFSLRRRQNLRSSNSNKKVNKPQFYQQQQLKTPRKKQKIQQPIQKKEQQKIIQQQQVIVNNQNFFVERQQISEPHQNYWLDSENKIFQDQSFLSPLTPKLDQELPQLQKVRIIELSQQEIENLKMSMLQNSNDYVPCIIAQNKITKIIY